MIPTIGHIALIFALLLSVAQSVLPFIKIKKSEVLAKRITYAMFVCVGVSFAALTYCYIVSDFSVFNVLQNSHTQKPLLYRITGVWGNHEGSLLLWILVLTTWALFVARSKVIPAIMHIRVLAVQGMIAFGFILFTLATSNPFARIYPVPREGMDLNPVLQDIGLAIHPPLLYMGYVGFSITFCFAMAALAEKKIDQTWASIMRPWVLAAWSALTAGITAGSAWAYYELGWGGFWFWDPVENASLMPWLAGTALLHSVAVMEKRNALPNWTIFLAILAFSLSLLGTFLVRSGILTSVHAFANDPTRGIFILAMLVVATGGALLFYALRAPKISAGNGFSTVSRESALLLNNVFLFTFCITVLLGTFYPVFLSALDQGSVTVGPPYYVATMLPLLVPFVLLMGAAPAMAWRRANFSKLAIPFILTALLVAFLCFIPMQEKFLMVLAFAMAAWIIITTMYDLLKKIKMRPAVSYFGMVMAHLGFALLILGVAGTTLWKQEQTLWMKAGDRVTVAAREFVFLGTKESDGPNYARNTGIFTMNGEYMTPEKRWYPVQAKMTSEVALKMQNLSLAYIVMGDQDKIDADRWVVRIYYHPLVLLIFIGGLLIAAGAVVSMFDRKRSV